MVKSKKKESPTGIRLVDTGHTARIDELVEYAGNANIHTPEQIDQIVTSILQCGGFNDPIGVGAGMVIVEGHGRLYAARKLGMEVVPIIDLSYLTEGQQQAYILAHNKINRNSAFDPEKYATELAQIMVNLPDLDVEALGICDAALMAEIEKAARQFDGAGGEVGPADEVPEPPVQVRTVRGDIWLLDEHRVMCGDSLDIGDINLLTNGATPDIANCDPPYGISAVKGGHIGGAKPFGKVIGGGMTRFGREHGRAKNAIIEPGLYAPIIGDDTIKTALLCYNILFDLGVKIICLWGGNYYAGSLPNSRCWLVWDKETNGNFADAELAWTNQDRVVELFKHQWSGLIKASERGEKRCHPTQKPVALAEWVINTLAPKSKSVLDLFLGSGSTLIACEKTGRRCYGMELAPQYVDVCVRRWQDFTGRDATNARTGKTFNKTRAR